MFHTDEKLTERENNTRVTWKMASMLWKEGDYIEKYQYVICFFKILVINHKL